MSSMFELLMNQCSKYSEVLGYGEIANELVKCILSIMEVDSSLHFDIY